MRSKGTAMKCPKCGAEVQYGNRYCGSCGKDTQDAIVSSGQADSATMVSTSTEHQFIPMEKSGVLMARHQRASGDVIHIVYPTSNITIRAEEAGVGVDINPVLGRFGFGGKVKNVSVTETKFAILEYYEGSPPAESERQAFIEDDSRVLSGHTSSNIAAENLTLKESKSVALADHIHITDSVKVVKYDKDGNLIEEREG